MNANEYQEAARRTHPDFEQDLMVEKRLSRIAMLMHSQLGLTSECGEFADALKKHVIYGKQLDRENLCEELGDLLWYIALACDALSCDFSGIMEANINKLKIRYPEKFTEKDAVERKDKIDYLSDKHRCPSCGSLDHTICGGEF